MLSHKILTQADLDQVAHYYEDSKDDYYAKEGASCWQGKGAEFLNLSGDVDRKTFRHLLEGKVSEQAKSTRSSIRDDSKARIGIDFTFSAPKSVSMQAFIGGDERLIKAHDQAVRRALDLAEQRAQARQKIKGKSRVETTGNLIIAKFRHETNREVEPHLHTHSVIMNLTQRQDEEWRALHNDKIIKMTRYLGAVYRSELAKELKTLGYCLRLERKGLFELSHITREQVEAFSERSQQIEAQLKKQGLNRETATTGQKQIANLKTRKRKEAQKRDVVFEMWHQKAHEMGIDFNAYHPKEQGKNHSRTSQEKDPVVQLREITAQEAAQRSLRYALNHLTERQAAIKEIDLIETALEQAMGGATYEDIKACMDEKIQEGSLIQQEPLYQAAESTQKEEAKTRQGWIQSLTQKGIDPGKAQVTVDKAMAQGRLVEIEKLYTTQTALEWERTILKIEREGRNKVAPLMTQKHLLKGIKSFSLNAGQQEAAMLMTTTSNQVIGIQGFAGVGKSHMLRAAKSVIEQQDIKVIALAPYGTQVEALRELGVEAKTVASFLKSKDKGIDDRTLLLIDEAGVVPTRQMEQLLKCVQKEGTRVVLMGDVAQTKAVEAGRPFDQLQQAGMITARIEEIKRQENPELKEAVEKAARGQTLESLRKVTSITEIKGEQERYTTIKDRYLALTPKQREQALIISGTNEARRQINALIRHDLDLMGKGREVGMLIKRDTTQAERRFAKNYHRQDVIQPEKDYANGLKRGEIYHILETGPQNQLTVLSNTGKKIQFSPAKYRRLSVYSLEKSELSVGDQVRITRNDPKLKINNGDRFTVTSIAKDRITLTNDKKSCDLSPNKPLHLDYCYATTVTSSQGLESDLTLIDCDTKSLTVHQEAYYVAISRARYEAHIITDDQSRLPSAIMRKQVKTAALDVRPLKVQKEFIPELRKLERQQEETERER